jgi:regulator of protease activity HflC (stomatin/prohibitin superfamily)
VSALAPLLPPEVDPGWMRALGEAAAGIGRWLWANYRQELLTAGLVGLGALVRAAGRTVESGSTGLKFSFGRVAGEAGPGFHLLIPFLQVIRSVPTRARTLDLPAQQVTTLDGLVYRVDATLVYRVVDVHRALVEIDDLQRGMLQVLGLAVQEVLRSRGRAELYASDALDGDLSDLMARQLEPWGVQVERAGFPTIHPSDETTRVTQLDALGRERAGVLGDLRGAGVGLRSGLVLLGMAGRVVPRTHVLAARERAERTRRRRTVLERRAADEARRRRETAGPLARAARRARERRAAERQEEARAA